MVTAKGVKRAAEKMEKKVKTAAKKAAPKASSLKKGIAQKGKSLLVKTKTMAGEKVEKLTARKDALIKKLKEELAQKEKNLAETQKSLLQRTKESLSDFKNQAEAEVEKLRREMEVKGKALLELKNKAEGEAKKFKEEAETHSKALAGKVREFEAFRKIAENKIFELEGKVKEFLAKIGPKEKERPGLVTFKGNPLTLLGEEVKVGDKAPDFRVVDNSMQPAIIQSYKGKIKVITAVPSLDTPVCNMETRRFNEEAGKLADNVVILTISVDLPFAQARWCAAAGVEKLKTFSDYQDHSFGLAYGMLVKELKLLARAVFIVDEKDVIRYVELVPEIVQEPDYERILNAVRALL